MHFDRRLFHPLQHGQIFVSVHLFYIATGRECYHLHILLSPAENHQPLAVTKKNPAVFIFWLSKSFSNIKLKSLETNILKNEWKTVKSRWKMTNKS